MGQCTGCVKYILFIFNFALWLLGCALLSVGVWIKVDDAADYHVQRLTEKMDEEYQISYRANVTGDADVTETIAYLLILFGIILIIITFIGCCGAVRENQCLLAVFAVCLLALMLALFGIGAWAFVSRDNIDTDTEQLRNGTYGNLYRGIQSYYVNQTSREFMDTIQRELRCCGVKNSQDWQRYHRYRNVPASCEQESFERGCGHPYNYYAGEEIKEFLYDRFTILGAVAIGVGLCLGVGMAFALLLCCLIKRDTTLVVA